SANKLFSDSIDSAFCARAIAVSGFGIRRRANSRRRIWPWRRASLHSAQAGLVVRRKRGLSGRKRLDEGLCIALSPRRQRALWTIMTRVAPTSRSSRTGSALAEALARSRALYTA